MRALESHCLVFNASSATWASALPGEEDLGPIMSGELEPPGKRWRDRCEAAESREREAGAGLESLCAEARASDPVLWAVGAL